jgi:hypothetical protein
MRRRIATLVFAGLVALGVFGQVIGGDVGALASVDPANFTTPKPNPYFPLHPGRLYVYRGHEDGQHLLEHLTVTSKTKMIQGVSTTVIHDVLWADGRIAERTRDWYADANDGTVWYFGEATATYDRQGHVRSREGSWQAGVNGAVAGVIMAAHPHPTDAYRQEFLVRHAEDQAWIVQRNLRVRVPYGPLDNVVRSFEWTRLEPHVVSQKLYAPGLGIVQEMDVSGGNEFTELVAVRKA